MTRGKLVLVLLIFLAAAGLRSERLLDPWIGRHHSFGGAMIGNMGRNYLRYGYWQTRLGPVANSGHVPEERFTFYYHYPPLLPWLVSLSCQVFGVHEWSVRLVPLLFSLLSLGLLFAFARRFFSEGVALWALLFGAVMPMGSYYGAHVDFYGSVAVFFSLLAVYGYALWVESDGARGLSLCALGITLGCMTAWYAYFLVPLLLGHYYLISGRPRSWRPLILAILPVVVFSLFMIHRGILLSAGKGEILGTLLEKLIYRASYREASASGSSLPGPLSLAWIHGRDLLRLYSPPLLVLAAVWCCSFVASAWRRRLENRDWYLFILLGYGLLHNLVFPNVIPGHDYIGVGYAPGIALAAAVVLVAGYQYLAGRLGLTAARLGVCTAGVLIVASCLYLTQRLYSWHYTERDYIRTVQSWGEVIRAHSDASEAVLAPMKADIVLQYYVDRDMAFGVDTPEKLQGAQASPPARCLFVCPVGEARHFKDVLASLEGKYPCRTEEGLLLYTIQPGATAGAGGR